MFNKTRFRHFSLAIAIVAAIALGISAVLYNISCYFCYPVFIKYFRFIMPYEGFIPGFTYYVILGVLIIIGTNQICTQRPALRALSHPRNLLIIATGICGMMAWCIIKDALQVEFSSLIPMLGIDKLFNTIPHSDFLYESSYLYVIPVKYTAAIIGAIEECMYAFLLLFLTKHLRMRTTSTITLLAILRGIVHLHYGTLFSPIFMAPMSVFAAIYLIRTNRFIPLLIGHAICNYLIEASYAGSTSPFGSFTYYLETSALPLLALTGIILTLTTFANPSLNTMKYLNKDN